MLLLIVLMYINIYLFYIFFFYRGGEGKIIGRVYLYTGIVYGINGF